MAQTKTLCEELDRPAFNIVPVPAPAPNVAESQSMIPVPREEFAVLHALINNIARRVGIGQPEPEVLRIQRTVCEYYNVTLDELFSKRRTERIAWARAVGLLLVKDLLGFSQRDLKEHFQLRGNSAISHAIKQARIDIKNYRDKRAEVNFLMRKLRRPAAPSAASVPSATR
jgi:hypothetical protein